MSLGVVKEWIWQTAAGAYYWSGAARRGHRGRVAILTYHRVLTDHDLNAECAQPGMYVREHVFAMQMEYLRRHFQILSFRELLDRWTAGQWDAEASYCVITLDDGWLDNYRHAFPILKRLGMPATIFLPTDFIETSRWFWPERLSYLIRAAAMPDCGPARRETVLEVLRGALPHGAVGEDALAAAGSYDRVIELCKELDAERIEGLLARLSDCLEVAVPQSRVLVNWDEVREMSRYGITFGSHSCSHRLMTQLSASEIRNEVDRSAQVLCERGVETVPVFCYPNGNYNAACEQAVREAGYEAAVSCDSGTEGAVPSARFALRRISIHDDISKTPSLFALALSGLR